MALHCLRPPPPPCRLSGRCEHAASARRLQLPGRACLAARAAAAESAPLPDGWVTPGTARRPRAAGGVAAPPSPAHIDLDAGDATLNSVEEVREDAARLRSVLTPPSQRARVLGQQHLVDAYARVLGKHTALSAIASNETVRPAAAWRRLSLTLSLPQMLRSLTVSPTSIAECFEGLSQVVGAAEARAVCAREPSVLYQHPECVRGCLAALEEVLGSRSEAARAVSSNPTLLQPGRDAHCRNAVGALSTILGSAELAQELARRNSLLLGTSAGTLLGAFEALCRLFGGQASATRMVLKNPGLLRSNPRTLYGAWQVLTEVLGGEEAAREVVLRNSSVLRSRPITIRRAWECLTEIFGRDGASELIGNQLGLMRSRALTMRASHAQMVAALGSETALRVFSRTPALLQIRSVVLSYNWAHFSTYLGTKRAAELVLAVPQVMSLRVGRAARLTDALTRIFGDPETVADVVPPVLFRSRGEVLLERFEALCTAFGGDEARQRVLANPRLLITSRELEPAGLEMTRDAATLAAV